MSDQNTNPANGNGEGKWRKWLFNEISLVGVIIAMTLSVSNFVKAPAQKNTDDITEIKTNIALIQKDIETINKNHEAHIQDIVQSIKEMKDKDQELEKANTELDKQLIIYFGQRK